MASLLQALICSLYTLQYVLGADDTPFFNGKNNIIFIMSDDQDVMLDSMQAMPNVKSLIADKGLTFNRAYAQTPVCCPSRTEYVAGRTYHNVQSPKSDCQGVAATHNVYSNADAWFPKFHASDYRTAGMGKVTNDWTYMCQENLDLSSFDRVHVSCYYKEFFTETFYNKYPGIASGEIEEPTVNSPDEYYQTAQLGNASVDFIKEQLQKQKDGAEDAMPFIAWIAPYAPHTPADPAPWHEDFFQDVELVKEENYNPEDVSEYHRPICDNPPLTDEAEKFMTLLYRDRLRALLSIDDMVKGIIEAVDEYHDYDTGKGAWENTYVVYTSDHGYHIGQYRLPCEKYQPYEETIRVPLYWRGPGIPEGQTTDALVQNIDIVPTLLDVTEVAYSPDTYDGRSYKEILENGEAFAYNTDWRQKLFFEYRTIKNTPTGARFSSCAMWDVDSIGKIPDEWSLDNEGNSWRVLRIRNASYPDGEIDWFYGEFVGADWTDAENLANPYFYEFYDMDKDPFQTTNLYYNRDEAYLTDELFAELHQLVMEYALCAGADSCSPVGNLWPGTPFVSEGTVTTDQTDQTRRGKQAGAVGIGLMDFGKNKDGVYESVNSKWSPASVSVVISLAMVIGMCSLIVGFAIGSKMQPRQYTMPMQKVLN